MYLQGLGTDERCLTRVMVSRSEIDMVQIKERFNAAYGKTLESFIKVQYTIIIIGVKVLQLKKVISCLKFVLQACSP